MRNGRWGSLGTGDATHVVGRGLSGPWLPRERACPGAIRRPLRKDNVLSICLRRQPLEDSDRADLPTSGQCDGPLHGAKRVSECV